MAKSSKWNLGHIFFLSNSYLLGCIETQQNIYLLKCLHWSKSLFPRKMQGLPRDSLPLQWRSVRLREVCVPLIVGNRSAWSQTCSWDIHNLGLYSLLVTNNILSMSMILVLFLIRILKRHSKETYILRDLKQQTFFLSSHIPLKKIF